MISFNLGEAGFEVATCHTAADGLKAAEERPPVVVVLDLMLPDLPAREHTPPWRTWGSSS